MKLMAQETKIKIKQTEHWRIILNYAIRILTLVVPPFIVFTKCWHSYITEERKRLVNIPREIEELLSVLKYIQQI